MLKLNAVAPGAALAGAVLLSAAATLAGAAEVASGAAPASIGPPQRIVPIPEQPYETLPYTPSLDVSAMDRSADPCDDLYTYACGGWMKNNPIPADQTRWDVYGKLSVDNQRYLWGILRRCGAKPASGRTPTQQKIGDYFAACMDEEAIERAGLTPLQPDLDEIAALRRPGGARARCWATCICALRVPACSSASARSRTRAMPPRSSPAVGAGGLGLPDRDYYIKTDAKSVEIRAAYVEHVAKMFELLGRAAAGGGRECGHRDAHRDRAREGFAHARGAARSVQDLSPQRRWRLAAKLVRRLRLAGLLQGRRRWSRTRGSTSPSPRSSRS